ncbi:uncharacterized protein [Elaeis guineensis]|uniref:uncharacterized protein n=1 Tax=Elaeis guineensis var. tenera TaxID=51953 RepID=UPI003C6D7319
MAVMMGGLLKNDLKKSLTKTYLRNFSNMLANAEKYACTEEAFAEETPANSVTPIKVVLHYPDISGCIAKWAPELAELDVQYHSRPSIKAQVLADFIFECIILDGKCSEAAEVLKAGESSRIEEADTGSNSKKLWTLHIDGSSNATGLGAGLILTSPKGDVAGYALRFEFLTINNEVEYEALLACLKVAREAGVQHLKIFNDSQLAVGEIKGGYEAQEENMKKYLQKIKDLILTFLSFDIQQVLKADNTRVDTLSKLAALLPTDLQKGTYFEVLKASSLEKPLVVPQVDEEPCWIDPLLKYLRLGELPPDRKEARKIRK